MASKKIDAGQVRLLKKIHNDPESLGVYQAVVNTQATDQDKEWDNLPYMNTHAVRNNGGGFSLLADNLDI